VGGASRMADKSLQLRVPQGRSPLLQSTVWCAGRAPPRLRVGSGDPSATGRGDRQPQGTGDVSAT
jgi:hypothetical protein